MDMRANNPKVIDHGIFRLVNSDGAGRRPVRLVYTWGWRILFTMGTIEMLKWVTPVRRRRVFGILSAALMCLFGLPGHINNAKVWLEAWNFVAAAEWEPWNVGLVLVSLVLAAYALLPQVALDALSRKITEVRKNRPSTTLAHQAEKRVYTQRTASELFAATRDLTDVQIKRYSEPHVGKWIRIQGQVRNITQNEDFYYVMIGRMFDPVPYLCFFKPNWPTIETMSRGDRIAAEGVIHKIEKMILYVDRCELVDLGEEDDVLRP